MTREDHRWAVASAWLLVLGLTPMLRADVDGFEVKSRDVAQAVSAMLEQGHISRHHIDDSISAKVHQQFLELYDPTKSYFLTSDMDEFSKFQDQHDDFVLGGRLNLALAVHKRFLERLDERSLWAKELVEQPFDFAVEEVLPIDPKEMNHAGNTDESRERWRKRIKFDIVSLMVDGKTEKDARERVAKRYRNISRNWHQVDSEELLEMYLTALSSSYDPHSTYMSSRTLDDFNISIQLSLEGIGALLSSEDGTTVVREVVPGGAAARDGRLKVGDQIVAVGEGDNGEIVDLQDMKLRNVVGLIRGKAGTIVQIEVIPANSQQRAIYKLTRQRIELQDREAKGEIVTVPGGNGADLRVGVINLPSFYADSEAVREGALQAKTATNDVRRILEGFNKEKVDGVVVDLRTNGGGLLSEAIGLTGLFIDDGPVVQVKDFNNHVTRFMDESPGLAYSGPLVVLVSKFSASASEIFAGAIQDYRRGIIVGDSSTHGKGTVQKILDVGQQIGGDASLGALKLTMQQFYRINGDSTQNLGVRSDVVLPARSDHDDFSESKLENALAFDRIGKARYALMKSINPMVIDEIRKLSLARLGAEPELTELVRQKKQIDERRARKEIQFSEARLRKEREELKDEEEDLPDADNGELPKKEEKPFGSDAYSREVLRIAADTIRLTDKGLAARRPAVQ